MIVRNSCCHFANSYQASLVHFHSGLNDWDKTNAKDVIKDVDGFKIGKCKKGEDIAACTDGGNTYEVAPKEQHGCSSKHSGWQFTISCNGQSATSCFCEE